MTKVLVVYGTKMGGTRDIAVMIGDALGRAGLEVQVSNALDVMSADGFDAAVIGSAIYATRWRPEAVQLLARVAEGEKPIPTWLFQSGPCGKDAATTRTHAPKRVCRLASILGAEEPITFGGRFEPGTARGFMARKMAQGQLAGDFRDFDLIRNWSRDIAAQLVSVEQTHLRR